jgi:hypothetical protein
MRKVAEHPGAVGREADIANKLWGIAGVAAAYLQWDTADAAASLARRLGGAQSIGAGVGFRSLCQLSPAFALRARELALRATRPSTRVGYPKLWQAMICGAAN